MKSSVLAEQCFSYSHSPAESIREEAADIALESGGVPSGSGMIQHIEQMYQTGCNRSSAQ